jgi:hypothetical protein
MIAAKSCNNIGVKLRIDLQALFDECAAGVLLANLDQEFTSCPRAEPVQLLDLAMKAEVVDEIINDFAK